MYNIILNIDPAACCNGVKNLVKKITVICNTHQSNIPNEMKATILNDILDFLPLYT